MVPTVRLALADLRQNKAQTLALAGFVALAALLVDLGLVLATGYPASFDDQARTARLPQVMLLESDRVYSDAQVTALADQPGVTAVEHEPALLFLNASFTFRDGTSKTAFAPFFVDYGSARHLDVPRLREGAQPLGDGVYLPYYYQVTAGYALGDTFTVVLDGTPVDLTVRGFTDGVFGQPPAADPAHRFYVGTATFARLARQFPQSGSQYVKIDGAVRGDHLADTLQADGYLSGAPVENPTTGAVEVSVRTYDGTKTSSVFMGNVLAVVILAFALVGGLVSLLVVRFDVVASIEQATTSIGILKALGYTSGQVVGALLGRLGLVAGLGAVVGVGGSHAVLPLVARALEQQSARTWSPGLAVGPALTAVVVTVVAVLAVAGVATRRVRRLSPLTALRSGLRVHSFRRNHLPLATSRGPLAWLLAAKSAVQAKGQTVTVGVVVAGVTLMGTVVVASYENVGVRSDRFVAVIGGEVPDAWVTASTPDAVAQIQAALARRDGVRSAFLYTHWLPARLDGTATNAVVTDDFAQTEGTMLYRGRWPAHANEVAISWRHASALGVGVGDTVRVQAGGTEDEYLVTGLMQTVTEGGTRIALTTDGVHRLLPTFRNDEIYVYLDDPSQAKSLAAAVERDWAADGAQATAMGEMTHNLAATYGDVMLSVSFVVLLVAVTIITLVVFLVLSLAILQGRRGYGIQKAVGFTTGQLVRQVVATYLPVVAVGAVVGGLVGQAVFGSFMDALFQTMGIYTASMSADATTTAVLTAGVVLLAGAVASLVAARVRQVSPYLLITE